MAAFSDPRNIVKTFLTFACAAMLGTGFLPTGASAPTEGTANFTVTLVDPAGKYDKRVDAFWVTDANGVTVKNLRKDGRKRAGFLTQWKAVRMTTEIDGFSGATIGNWEPVTVTWDCRDTNNVVVPDGTYRFYVEFTDRNGPGPWTSNGIAFVKGPAGATNTYPNEGTHITGLRVVYTPNRE